MTKRQKSAIFDAAKNDIITPGEMEILLTLAQDRIRRSRRR